MIIAKGQEGIGHRVPSPACDILLCACCVGVLVVWLGVDCRYGLVYVYCCLGHCVPWPACEIVGLTITVLL